MGSSPLPPTSNGVVFVTFNGALAVFTGNDLR